MLSTLLFVIVKKQSIVYDKEDDQYDSSYDNHEFSHIDRWSCNALMYASISPTVLASCDFQHDHRSWFVTHKLLLPLAARLTMKTTMMRMIRMLLLMRMIRMMMLMRMIRKRLVVVAAYSRPSLPLCTWSKSIASVRWSRARVCSSMKESSPSWTDGDVDAWTTTKQVALQSRTNHFQHHGSYRDLTSLLLPPVLLLLLLTSVVVRTGVHRRD